MSERQSTNDKAGPVQRPENDSEGSKSMAPPPFALGASHAGGPGGGGGGGAQVPENYNVGLGLDKKTGM